MMFCLQIRGMSSGDIRIVKLRSHSSQEMEDYHEAPVMSQKFLRETPTPDWYDTEETEKGVSDCDKNIIIIYL